ncbi:MAG: DUF2125 domain-containing protein [Sulfitobacter sp.]
MRRLTWLFLILATLWCAWWALASTGMQSAVTHWLDGQPAKGWQVDVSEVSKHGFPLSLRTRLNDVDIVDPATNVTIKTSHLDLIAAAYWPGYVTIKAPETPIVLSSPAGQIIIQAVDGRADLKLRPSPSLELQSMGISSGFWKVVSGQTNLISADNLKAMITQDNSVAEVYDIIFEAKNLIPGNDARTLLALPISWPTAFDAFDADLSVTFDNVWDRTAEPDNWPQPRAIDLRQIEIMWGDLAVLASGQLTIDPKGIPTGSIKVDVTNWAKLVDLGTKSGALPVQQRPQVEIMLGALSNLSGSPDDLNLILAFKDGQMALGPINLGPAPRLILR